jgi:hypothetical protein
MISDLQRAQRTTHDPEALTPVYVPYPLMPCAPMPMIVRLVPIATPYWTTTTGGTFATFIHHVQLPAEQL